MTVCSSSDVRAHLSFVLNPNVSRTVPPPPTKVGLTGDVESGGGEGAVGTSSGNAKPNVFFFLIDDMGYGDIGYQSTDLSELTPNLDTLAAGGVKVRENLSLICVVYFVDGRELLSLLLLAVERWLSAPRALPIRSTLGSHGMMLFDARCLTFWAQV